MIFIAASEVKSVHLVRVHDTLSVHEIISPSLFIFRAKVPPNYLMC
jgi:hypothetical protein